MDIVSSLSYSCPHALGVAGYEGRGDRGACLFSAPADPSHESEKGHLEHRPPSLDGHNTFGNELKGKCLPDELTI